MGLASAWLSDRLLQLDAVRPKGRGCGLVRNPLVQGGVAASWALLVLSGGLSWPVAAAGLLAVPLIQVGITDLQYRCVYTLVAGCWLVVSMALRPAIHAASPWAGVGGAAVGLTSMALLRELGRLRYCAGAMGRGDLTIAGLVGATAGPEAIVAVASGVVLSGIVALSLVARGRSRTAQIAYGPGLCLGGLVCLVFRRHAGWP